MTHYTVCCAYASHYHNTVTVEADTLDAALEKAIEQAGDDPHWKSVDQASQTFVEALAEGMDAALRHVSEAVWECLDPPGQPGRRDRWRRVRSGS